ncbi:MAG: FAD-dependent oxidoreductase, partial [Clostridiales bacterium]|nr:FAD-dependent oxidoreductase [Clostridiales bacterium]
MMQQYDTIIIGGGTAGLTAALYLRRENKRVMLLEKEGFGGQILYAPRVENYPGFLSVGGAEFIDRLLEQVENLGTDYSLEEVLRVEKTADNAFAVHTDSGLYGARTVVLATGLVRRRLDVPGEDALIGRGVSYCAVCDGAFYRGMTATVAGGGNTALSDVLHLADYCTTVNLVHRRTAFRAEHALVERVKALANVRLYLDETVTGLRTADGKLAALTLRHTKTGAATDLATDGLFVSVGKLPQNAAFAPLVALDEAGYIIADENTRTSCPGVFAAGDCRTKRIRQLTTAAADGTAAAL